MEGCAINGRIISRKDLLSIGLLGKCAFELEGGELLESMYWVLGCVVVVGDEFL